MSEKKILLLGLGMQGQAALYDLVQAGGCRILVADVRPDLPSRLRHYPAEVVSGRRLEAGDETELVSLMREADVVVEALPGAYALPVGRLAAACGVHLVSSMYYLDPGERDEAKRRALEKELRELDRRARETGATILNELGLDPGIDLVLAAKAVSELDRVEELTSYGAGLPMLEAADNPLKYKFSWSVKGVLRSYVRPARILHEGRPHDIDGKEIFAPRNRRSLYLDELEASLECFPNGNSVRYAEVFHIEDSVKEMARYACRWPGHGALWEIMAKSGFLDEAPLDVDGQKVSPIELMASLLDAQPQFHYADDEQDFALARVDARGTAGGERKRIVYQLLDRRDLHTGFTAMQRTVGFTLSLGARLILEGQLARGGLVSPVEVPYELVRRGLERHGMHIRRLALPWHQRAQG